MIILFEIGIGAFGYARQDELNAALDKGFNQTLKDYKTNEKAWDLVQTEVQMCSKLFLFTILLNHQIILKCNLFPICR